MALLDSGDGSAGHGGVGAGRKLLVQIDDVDKVVMDAAALGSSEFGGADVEPSVDLNGVTTDDFSANALGQSQREF